ncbi:Uncharacterized protein dnm_005980 [Desulfonema magnum]|uniref:Uncharacterized protein n=1 Tax=Desulfonema magnum TaxID=45655 RepID=A0A975GKC4_9BACT|nr:Uncharacterized protein dnm_005980 [Desulfonema magnum]
MFDLCRRQSLGSRIPKQSLTAIKLRIIPSGKNSFWRGCEK